ncbi:dihydroneopterin aldolase [Ancylobacter sp. 6x-1]|uniref:7,8-dihydroneopterin aldolase n=1 Tax=Ancylobacter crimeensis TaxID=2579147 RepID=A0ABT0D8M9_9HYPH|nr:dihydroneopterin aldolase [Ancylobacter crimeensis]MCK0196308.1 dihydroneopterin aldolase [Ancylobacter crimeensis]
MSDRVFLRGIELFAHHGLYPEEAKLGQRFVVDIDWWLDTRQAARDDDYEETVGYQEVYETVTRVSAEHRFHILEAFAEGIAAAILKRFGRIEKVRVEVHKPSAPIAGVFRDVGVDITRTRG